MTLTKGDDTSYKCDISHTGDLSSFGAIDVSSIELGRSMKMCNSKCKKMIILKLNWVGTDLHVNRIFIIFCLFLPACSTFVKDKMCHKWCKPFADFERFCYSINFTDFRSALKQTNRSQALQLKYFDLSLSKIYLLGET